MTSISLYCVGYQSRLEVKIMKTSLYIEVYHYILCVVLLPVDIFNPNMERVPVLD